jgi:regulator of protease activity HflC (stomatin/prohibitin superfamily)
MNTQRTLRRLWTSSIFAILLGLFIVIILWRHMIITVPAGHNGVMWWRFFGGTDMTSSAKGEGVHIIPPWDRMFIYDTRLQEDTEVFTIVANNGLNLRVTASIRWRARPNRLGELHRTIGPDYMKRLILPEVGSILRETISRYDAEDLYAKDRLTIQKAIYAALVAAVGNELGGRREEDDPTALISVKDVLIAEVELPETLRAAIERKFAQAELVEEYRFRVQREELESQRKEIEANGIRRFQAMVAPTISDAYLRWSGIEATLKLAQSPNSKVVIMGNGPGGLPVILNGFDGEKPFVMPDVAPPAPPLAAPGPPPANK